MRRNGFGRQIDSFEADLDVAGFDHAVPRACSSGRRSSSGSGADVEVLARVDGQPVCCRQGPVLVTSFHPELLGRHPASHELFLTTFDADASHRPS